MEDRDKRNARRREQRKQWTPEQREAERQRQKKVQENISPEQRQRYEQRKKIYYASNAEAKARKREQDRAAYARRRAELTPEALERLRAEQQAYRDANRERLRAQNKERALFRKYGLLPGAKDALLSQQEGVCAVCGTDKPGTRNGWHTDHCHNTQVVRGILCQKCNVTLGLLGDSLEAVEAKARLFLAYLAKVRN